MLPFLNTELVIPLHKTIPQLLTALNFRVKSKLFSWDCQVLPDLTPVTAASPKHTPPPQGLFCSPIQMSVVPQMGFAYCPFNALAHAIPSAQNSLHLPLPLPKLTFNLQDWDHTSHSLWNIPQTSHLPEKIAFLCVTPQHLVIQQLRPLWILLDFLRIFPLDWAHEGFVCLRAYQLFNK